MAIPVENLLWPRRGLFRLFFPPYLAAISRKDGLWNFIRKVSLYFEKDTKKIIRLFDYSRFVMDNWYVYE